MTQDTSIPIIPLNEGHSDDSEADCYAVFPTERQSYPAGDFNI